MDKAALQKYSKAAEMAGNLGIVALAITAILIFITGWSSKSPTVISPNVKGARIIAPHELALRTPRTVILVLSTTCRYCYANIPFYQSLRTLQRGMMPQLDIVAVFPNDKEAVSRFLSSAKLDIPVYTKVRLSDMRASGTPTLLLVDKAGMILDAWQGQLSEELQKQVRQRIVRFAAPIGGR